MTIKNFVSLLNLKISGGQKKYKVAWHVWGLISYCITTCAYNTRQNLIQLDVTTVINCYMLSTWMMHSMNLVTIIRKISLY